jgi:hypothetical protein
MTAWSVLVERAAPDNEPGDRDEIESKLNELQSRLADRWVVVGGNDKTWWAQIVVEASTGSDALLDASGIFTNNAYAIGLPLWRVVNVESIPADVIAARKRAESTSDRQPDLAKSTRDIDGVIT